MKSTLAMAAAVAAIVTGVSAQAAMLAYTGMEGQATGVLSNTVNDGAGWGTWDPQNEAAGHVIANTTPLTFGGLVTGAEGNYVTGSGNWTSVGRGLLTSNGSVLQTAGLVSDPWTVKTVDSGTVWFSFLARAHTTNAGGFFQLHGANIAWSDDVGIKIGNQGGTWSAALTTGAYAATSATIQADVTTLMVGRYGFNGADSSFHFWALSDPAAVALGGADLSLATATSSITGVDSTAIDFRSFKAYLNNGSSNSVAIDEIRFGTSFADVTPVPEPTSLAAIAATGLLLVRRRK